MAVATKHNGTVISYGTLSGHTGAPVVTHIGLYDTPTPGTGVLKFVGVLTPARTILPGDIINAAVGAVAFTFQGAGGAVIGDAIALAALDAMLGSTTLGPVTYYAALLTAPPTGAGGGTEFPSTGTYTRPAITDNPTNFPAATMV